jgi:hypothetical protein
MPLLLKLPGSLEESGCGGNSRVRLEGAAYLQEEAVRPLVRPSDCF